jgi:hypothetical protein
MDTPLRAGGYVADLVTRGEFFEVDTLPLSLKAILIERLSSGLVTDLRVLRDTVFHHEPSKTDLPTLSPVPNIPFGDRNGLVLPRQNAR